MGNLCFKSDASCLIIIIIKGFFEVFSSTRRTSAKLVTLLTKLRRKLYLPFVSLIHFSIACLQLIYSFPLHSKQLTHLCRHQLSTIIFSCRKQDVALSFDLAFQHFILLKESFYLGLFECQHIFCFWINIRSRYLLHVFRYFKFCFLLRKLLL